MLRSDAVSAPRKTALMLRHRVLSAFIFEVEAEEAEEAEGAEEGGEKTTKKSAAASQETSREL